MPAPRKTRSDSASSAAEAAQKAMEGLPKMPAHLHVSAAELPFLQAVLRSRAREEWDPANLPLAAQVASVMNRIEEQTRLLQAEGAIVNGKRNPRVGLIDSQSRLELALLRSMKLTGRIAGDGRHELQRRALQREADDLADDFDDDDGLLAR